VLRSTGTKYTILTEHRLDTENVAGADEIIKERTQDIVLTSACKKNRIMKQKKN
jgi:hypothetical protein